MPGPVLGWPGMQISAGGPPTLSLLPSHPVSLCHSSLHSGTLQPDIVPTRWEGGLVTCQCRAKCGVGRRSWVAPLHQEVPAGPPEPLANVPAGSDGGQGTGSTSFMGALSRNTVWVCRNGPEDCGRSADHQVSLDRPCCVWGRHVSVHIQWFIIDGPKYIKMES